MAPRLSEMLGRFVLPQNETLPRGIADFVLHFMKRLQPLWNAVEQIICAHELSEHVALRFLAFSASAHIGGPVRQRPRPGLVRPELTLAFAGTQNHARRSIQAVSKWGAKRHPLSFSSRGEHRLTLSR